MVKSTRSSQRVLKTVGSGSSVNLCTAVPQGMGQLPHAPQLSKTATQRLKWLDYRKTHTATQTCRHFDIARSTLNRWTKRFKPHDLTRLEDHSSRPNRVRARTWGTAEVDAILAVCTQYPRWGKAKLAVLLKRHGHPLSASMVGRILDYLKRRRLLREPRGVRTTPRARHPRPHAQRKPKGIPLPKDRPGALVEIDTMQLSPLPGVVRYHFSAVDCASRYGVIGIRGTATAGTAKDFLTEMQIRFPFPIQAIQIDGGGEWMAQFEQACQEEKIPLWVLPPRSPKLNGQVERINRTFREEWWEWYGGEVDVASMQTAAREGERVYNEIRPHQSLGMCTPVEYLAERFGIHV